MNNTQIDCLKGVCYRYSRQKSNQSSYIILNTFGVTRDP